MCHLLLLMPVIALPIFWMVPITAASLIYATVFAISLWLYWFVWQAMRRPVATGREELLHATGRVLEVRGESAQVRIHSEFWSAVSLDPLKRDDMVEVTGIDGLELQVRRLDHATARTALRSERLI